MILTKDEEEKLRKFERKIYSSKKAMEGVQRLMKSEVQERLLGEDVVKAVKRQRLRRYGHIRRTGGKKAVKKVTE